MEFSWNCALSHGRWNIINWSRIPWYKHTSPPAFDKSSQSLHGCSVIHCPAVSLQSTGWFAQVALLQRAKKVVSDSLGLVDFAIRLVNSVFNWPNGQVKFLRNSNYRRTVRSILLIKTFWRLVEMMFGLVNVSFSLPEWQDVKMTFFAPCCYKEIFMNLSCFICLWWAGYVICTVLVWRTGFFC